VTSRFGFQATACSNRLLARGLKGVDGRRCSVLGRPERAVCSSSRKPDTAGPCRPATLRPGCCPGYHDAAGHVNSQAVIQRTWPSQRPMGGRCLANREAFNRRGPEGKKRRRRGANTNRCCRGSLGRPGLTQASWGEPGRCRPPFIGFCRRNRWHLPSRRKRSSSQQQGHPAKTLTRATPRSGDRRAASETGVLPMAPGDFARQASADACGRWLTIAKACG